MNAASGHLKASYWNGCRREHGAVLVVSLLMLLVMTLIGITGVQVTSLEEKMAGNSRDRNLAFQSAEAALRVGEGEIATAVAVDANGNQTGIGLAAFELLFNSSGTNGYYSKDTVTDALLLGDASSWASNKVKTPNPALALNSVSAQPKYLIEKLDPDGTGKKHPFRITAYATGGTTSAVVVLQSTYEVDVP